jgi:hypothetical protein
MKRLLILFCFSATLALAAANATKPKLVLAIIIDQFRYDYLTRFRGDYKGAFDQLLTQGAVFSNAYYDHFPTVTAIGHCAVLTGSMPSVSGIIGNDWYDRDAGRQVTSVSDDSVKLLGGTGKAGASPRRMAVSTVGDELKIANAGRSKVIGISLKDRAAILPAGHSANAAYWFDGKSGHFVSSTYYFPELPAWVRDFNQKTPASFKGAEWMGRKLPDDERAYSLLAATPYANELVESFAERAIDEEKRGGGPTTDLLAVSFSGNDYVGHEFGPDSPEVKDISIRTDMVLAKLFRFIDAQMGMQNVLVVFTSDHGVAPMPEANAARHMPGGRMPAGIIQESVQKALEQKYGPGKWILSPSEHSLYLNLPMIREKNLNRTEVAREAKDAVAAIPHVARVYTYDQLETGSVVPDEVSRRVLNGFNLRSGADVYILLEPYWMFGKLGTTHGSAYNYDAHVPVIFMGHGIRAGLYVQSIVVNDIAPTLTTLLDVESPSGSVGRVLSEILSDK